MFCSLMSVFLYFSGFEPFAPLERWCDFAKFWCGKKKLVAVLDFSDRTMIQAYNHLWNNFLWTSHAHRHPLRDCISSPIQNLVHAKS